MFTVIKNGDRTQPYVAEIIVDSEADMYKIPVRDFSPGTSCLVLDVGTVNMLGNDFLWHEV